MPAPDRIEQPPCMSGQCRTATAWPGDDALGAPRMRQARKAMMASAPGMFRKLPDILLPNHRNAPNARDSSLRAARMSFAAILDGRFAGPAVLTVFEKTCGFARGVVEGPVAARSLRACHTQCIPRAGVATHRLSWRAA